MEAKMSDEPVVFVEGIDVVIRRDLEKHKGMLSNRRNDLDVWNKDAGHLIAMKKHYRKQVGGGKFNDEALEESVKQINLNITHLQQKVKLAKDAIEHETLIVDTLTENLHQYELDYANFYKLPQ